MAKYSKYVNLLIKVTNEQNISINVNSEKTAISNLNKLVEIIESISIFSKYINKDLGGYTLEEYLNGSATSSIYKFSDIFDNIEEFKNCVNILKQNKIIGYKYERQTFSVRDFNLKDKSLYIKNKIERENITAPFYRLLLSPFKNGEQLDYAYSIEFLPTLETQTQKRVAYNSINDLYNEIRSIIGTKILLPKECIVHNYDKYHTINMEVLLKHLKNTYLSPDYIPRPATPKQTYWVAKILNIPENLILNKVNMYQASEILEICFNKEQRYNENEINDIKAFYLDKFKMNENIKTIRLTETDLKKIIKESVKKILLLK